MMKVQLLYNVRLNQVRLDSIILQSITPYFGQREVRLSHKRCFLISNVKGIRIKQHTSFQK